MSTRRDCFLWKVLSILVIIALVGCTRQPLPPVDPYNQPAPNNLTPLPSPGFAPRVSYTPSEARYFDLIDQTFSLTPQERALLEQNGFFVSDRLAFEDFTTAYAYIYWKDLPVLVTSDSILHSIHQTYDDLLMRIEFLILIPKLTALLSATRTQIKLAAQANTDHNLEQAYTDLELYLTVPLVLLSTDNGAGYDTPGVDRYVELAEAAEEVAPTGLLGTTGEVDFTLFKPRGHYTQGPELGRYFRAMSWLEHIDFALIEYSPQGNARFNPEALSAAMILRDAIQQAGQRPTWDEIDLLVSSLIGRSDNMTLGDLDRFLSDAGITDPAALADYPDPERLVKLLTSQDYGQQRITGQILYVASSKVDPIERPASFRLLGSRFSVESYLMSNLVYDRLIVDGAKVERPLPNPLDVMYVLGNDRAADHLQGELEQYGYADNLASLRGSVAQYQPGFWSGNVYNRWLDLVRKLSLNTTADMFPQSMRTAAWADKALQTQLASWAQLRHDNILYLKQSFTAIPTCEYPAGYVEPYPAFYAAVQEYARFGQTLLSQVSLNGLNSEAQDMYQKAAAYFENLGTIAKKLQTLSEKELLRQPFTKDEELFLKSVAIRQLEEQRGCGVYYEEKWHGWYLDLFPWQDKSPALIADIHTNPNTDAAHPNLLPPSVLHVAAGPVAGLVFLVDTDEGVTAYVGPSFTYFEVNEEGFPPKRLTDEEWKQRLLSDQPPMPPAWTSSFRLPRASAPVFLELEKANEWSK